MKEVRGAPGVRASPALSAVLLAALLLPLAAVQAASYPVGKVCKTGLYEVYSEEYAVEVCSWVDWSGVLHVEFRVYEPVVVQEYKSVCLIDFFGLCLFGYDESRAVGVAMVLVGEAAWDNDYRHLQWSRDFEKEAKVKILATIDSVEKEVYEQIVNSIKEKMIDTVHDEARDVMFEVTKLKGLKPVFDAIDALETIRGGAELAAWAKGRADRIVDLVIRHANLVVLKTCITAAAMNIPRDAYEPSIVVRDLIVGIEARSAGLCELVDTLNR